MDENNKSPADCSAGLLYIFPGNAGSDQNTPTARIYCQLFIGRMWICGGADVPEHFAVIVVGSIL